MVGLSLPGLLLLFTIAGICNGMGYMNQNAAKLLTVPMCDMKDCFMRGWCDRHICSGQKPKSLKCCTGNCLGGMRHIYASDPHWIYPPEVVRDRNGRVWFNCKCPCCDACAEDGVAAPEQKAPMSKFLQMLLARKMAGKK